MNEEAILEDAHARVEQHRKGDAMVIVKDAAGKLTPDAVATVEQTRHDFLFGCNIFRWGAHREQEREQAYRQRFAELLNYATLGFYW